MIMRKQIAVKLKNDRILTGTKGMIHFDVIVAFNLLDKNIKSCGWLINEKYTKSYIPHK